MCVRVCTSGCIVYFLTCEIPVSLFFFLIGSGKHILQCAKKVGSGYHRKLGNQLQNGVRGGSAGSSDFLGPSPSAATMAHLTSVVKEALAGQ